MNHSDATRLILGTGPVDAGMEEDGERDDSSKSFHSDGTKQVAPIASILGRKQLEVINVTWYPRATRC